MKQLIWTILGLCVILNSCTNALDGYEWLEGTWTGEIPHHVVVKITPTYFQAVNDIHDTNMNINEAKRQSYTIKMVNSFIGDVMAICPKDGAEEFYIDENKKAVYWLYDFDQKIYLNKKSNVNPVHTIDVLDIDNNTNFNIVKFKKDAVFHGDYWFSEIGEMVTDGKWWGTGKYKSNGYYTYHRFNSTQYTCTFLDDNEVKGEDGYGDNIAFGKAIRDKSRSSLPEQDGYYVLDLRQWEGYVPLYFPYSKEYICSNFRRGDIVFEYIETDTQTKRHYSTPNNGLPTSTSTQTNRSNSATGDYSWIYGTWRLDINGDSIILSFNSSGMYILSFYGAYGKNSETGVYDILGDRIKLTSSQDRYSSYIYIEGHSLKDSDGHYYRKR